MSLTIRFFSRQASFKIHYTCDEDNGDIHIMLETNGERWIGLGFVQPGKALRMSEANMMLMHTRSGKWTVSEFNGRQSMAPVVDSEQNLRNIKVSVVDTDPETALYKAAFTRSIEQKSANDFGLPRGDVGVLWAFGVYGYTQGQTKHAQNIGRGTTYIAFCKQPPTTTTTKTTTTTATSTTSTRTSTTTTTTSTTTTSTTTTLEADPTLPLLLAPPMLGNTVDLASLMEKGWAHGPEVGLHAEYYDYAGKGDLVGKEYDARVCSFRTSHHGNTPDATAVVPSMNFPAHVTHYMGSPTQLNEHFCTRFEGWLEVPQAAEYVGYIWP